MNRKLVDEFAKTAVDYGKTFYQYYEARELVKRQRQSLGILRKWERHPSTRRVSGHALESLRQEILQTRQRIWSDTRYSKYLGTHVASLKRALESKKRELVAAT